MSTTELMNRWLRERYAFDESKVKRDAEGKFAEKAGGFHTVVNIDGVPTIRMDEATVISNLPKPPRWNLTKSAKREIAEVMSERNIPNAVWAAEWLIDHKRHNMSDFVGEDVYDKHYRKVESAVEKQIAQAEKQLGVSSDTSGIPLIGEQDWEDWYGEYFSLNIDPQIESALNEQLRSMDFTNETQVERDASVLSKTVQNLTKTAYNPRVSGLAISGDRPWYTPETLQWLHESEPDVDFAKLVANYVGQDYIRQMTPVIQHQLPNHAWATGFDPENDSEEVQDLIADIDFPWTPDDWYTPDGDIDYAKASQQMGEFTAQLWNQIDTVWRNANNETAIAKRLKGMDYDPFVEDDQYSFASRMNRWLRERYALPQSDEESALIADILYHTYGDNAAAMLDQVDRYAAKFDENKHKRDAAGRFAKKNESVAAIHDAIKTALSGGQHSPESVQGLADNLSQLTVRELTELKKQYGISAAGRSKADLVAKVADRLSRGRREAGQQQQPKNTAATVPSVDDMIQQGKSYGDYVGQLDDLFRNETISEDEWQAAHDAKPSAIQWNDAVWLQGKHGYYAGGASGKNRAIGPIVGASVKNRQAYVHIQDQDGEIIKAPADDVYDFHERLKNDLVTDRVDDNYTKNTAVQQYIDQLVNQKHSGKNLDEVIRESFGEIPWRQKSSLRKAMADAREAKATADAQPSQARAKAMEASSRKNVEQQQSSEPEPDVYAPESLFSMNQGLVNALASKMGGQHEQDELRQVGRIALWKASQQWKPDSGTKFSTFAYTGIAQAIKNAQRTEGRQKSKAQEFGVDEEDGDQSQQVPGRDAAPGEDMEKQEQLGQLQDAMKQLQSKSPDAAKMVMMKFSGRKLSEIAAEFGITEQGASQAVSRAVKKLQTMMGADKMQRTGDIVRYMDAWIRERYAFERHNEHAALIADILAHIYGDEAATILDAPDQYSLPQQMDMWIRERYGRQWDESQVKRDEKGRFATRAGKLANVASSIQNALQQPKTPQSAKALADELSQLTVKELTDLKKQYQISASGRTKADLVQKLASRLDMGRREEQPKRPEMADPAETLDADFVDDYFNGDMGAAIEAMERNRAEQISTAAKRGVDYDTDEIDADWMAEVAGMAEGEDSEPMVAKEPAKLKGFDELPSSVQSHIERHVGIIANAKKQIDIARGMDKRFGGGDRYENEVRDKFAEAMRASESKLDEFKAMAKDNGFDGEAIIRGLAGEPEPTLQPQPEPAKAPANLLGDDDDEPFVLQQPRKGRKQEKFETAPSGPQKALFDTGKNDLEGQNLLFNSDAGAGEDDPTTMENRMRGKRDEDATEPAKPTVPKGLDPVFYRQGLEAAGLKAKTDGSTEGVAQFYGLKPGTFPYQSFVVGIKAAEANRTPGKASKPAKKPSPAAPKAESAKTQLQANNDALDALQAKMQPLFLQRDELERESREFLDKIEEARYDEPLKRKLHRRQNHVNRKLKSIGEKLQPLKKEETAIRDESLQLIDTIRKADKLQSTIPRDRYSHLSPRGERIERLMAMVAAGFEQFVNMAGASGSGVPLLSQPPTPINPWNAAYADATNQDPDKQLSRYSFKESDHPRDDKGKFAEKAGGGTGGSRTTTHVVEGVYSKSVADEIEDSYTDPADLRSALEQGDSHEDWESAEYLSDEAKAQILAGGMSIQKTVKTAGFGPGQSFTMYNTSDGKYAGIAGVFFTPDASVSMEYAQEHRYDHLTELTVTIPPEKIASEQYLFDVAEGVLGSRPDYAFEAADDKKVQDALRKSGIVAVQFRDLSPNNNSEHDTVLILQEPETLSRYSFKEAEHPRDDSGKFVEKAGGGTGGSTDSFLTEFNQNLRKEAVSSTAATLMDEYDTIVRDYAEENVDSYTDDAGAVDFQSLASDAIHDLDDGDAVKHAANMLAISDPKAYQELTIEFGEHLKDHLDDEGLWSGTSQPNYDVEPMYAQEHMKEFAAQKYDAQADEMAAAIWQEYGSDLTDWAEENIGDYTDEDGEIDFESLAADAVSDIDRDTRYGGLLDLLANLESDGNQMLIDRIDAFLRPKIADFDIEYYERKSSGWITLNAEDGEGTKVYIGEGGKVTAGPKGMTGTTLSGDKPKKSGSKKRDDSDDADPFNAHSRSEAATDADDDWRFVKHKIPWQARKAVDEVAERWGVDADDMIPLAQEKLQTELANWETREAVKKHARKSLGLNSRVTSDMENSRSKRGEDFANLSGLDEFLTEAQDMYPDFNWGDDPAQNLMDAVHEGAKPKPKLHDKSILDSAARYLFQTGQVAEAVPFSMLKHFPRTRYSHTVAFDNFCDEFLENALKSLTS